MMYFGKCGRSPSNDPDTCLQVLDDTVSKEELTKYLTEYTVFSFVRNPFTRAASGYSFLNNEWREKNIDPKAYAKPHCTITWEDYCWNPRVLGEHCDSFPECC